MFDEINISLMFSLSQIKKKNNILISKFINTKILKKIKGRIKNLVQCTDYEHFPMYML